VVSEAKESYIASEWNDYTHNPNVDRLADKGATVLKGSEHEFDNFGKSEVQKVSQNYSYEQKQAKLQPEPKNNLNYKDTFSASINSGSDNRNVQDSLKNLNGPTNYTPTNFGQQSYNPPQQNYGQNDFLSSSNQYKSSGYNAPPPLSNVSSNNNLQASNYESVTSSYKPPVSQPIPTKDYTQPNNFMTSTNYQTPKPVDIAPQKIIASSYESSLTKDLIYTPKVDLPFQAPINTGALGGTQNGALGVAQYGASGVQSVSAGGKKKVFGLNVSDEFTNSWTIKKMAEPFRSNVVNIKTRARQFRSSLSGYIK